MAFHGPGETPTDEPFQRFLGPTEVASDVQSAIGACWHNVPADERSFQSVARQMEETFRQVEKWWLELQDRAGYRIVARIQEDFGPPPSLNAEDVRRALDDTDRRFAEMFRWMPGQSIASAFFDAWLLQPEASRDVSRTVSLVRQVLDRQLEAARHDIAAFGGS